MQDILQTIVAHKRLEVEALRKAHPNFTSRAEGGAGVRPAPSLRQALLASPTGIIAEFKRRSPSKGWIHEDASPSIVPLGYEQVGAAAISILTDEHFFGGHDDYICAARQSGVSLPILYKNFVIDELQLYQAVSCGASAVLLIAACLTLQECEVLMHKAHALGLEVLLEIHDESELPYTQLPADCIGVNNRNLGSFVTDVQNSFRLAPQLPADRVLVSESGISDPATIRQLRAAGFRGFLIGETFMREADPPAALKAFIHPSSPTGGLQGAFHSSLLKVCGMRDADNIRAVEALGIDWMGFIFWPGSPRYVSEPPAYLPQRARRVGVFVDTQPADILQHVRDYGLQLIQLHGHESPAYCTALREVCGADIALIKALPIAEEKDLEATKPYEGHVDYFLFDTRSPLPGGSGQHFDWSILDAYDGPVPFLLSGGIGPEDAPRLCAYRHPRCIGFDLNSCFESSPAIKDIKLLKSLTLNP